ncbi:MAG TPA: S1C family serine protease [Candidatus Blautia stercoravium]|nr:S1C family serine protease [Candidatus Blautia stercoravium]
MDEKKNEGQTNQEKKEESSYEFLKETIKAKPWNRKKLAKQVGKLLVSGAVFGFGAAVVFSVAAPAMTGKILEKKNASKVRFPQGEEQEEEEKKDGEDGVQEEELQESQDGENTSAPVVQDMTPEEYKKLYGDIFATADEAEKAMVTVIGNKNDEDWFQTPYEEQISGILVAESGQNYFVLTEYRIVENVDRIQVVFCDGTVTDARFQKSDQNTGLAVLKVDKSGLDSSLKEKIVVAPLGESYNLKLGEPVLAIGSPMGYSDSVGYGIVTSTSDKVSGVDAQYGLLTTDITGSSQGSGVILNLEGEIVGIIAQGFGGEKNGNLITGLPISQIKDLIQILSDENKEMVYLGITGEDITAEISEKKGIPVGIFVEKVEVDSPAMQVGIQNGDVIIELNGEKVETVKGYQQQLKSCKSGENVKVKAMRQGTEGYVEVSFNVTLKTR